MFLFFPVGWLGRMEERNPSPVRHPLLRAAGLDLALFASFPSTCAPRTGEDELKQGTSGSQAQLSQ